MNSTTTATNNNLQNEALYELLDRWTKIANDQSLFNKTCANDLSVVSKITEEKTLELTSTFQKLFQNSQEQSTRMQELTDLARTVKIGDDVIEFQEIATRLQDTFLNSIICILDMSKQAVVMVYSLDDALKTLSHIEKSINEIEIINHKTKYLSLNATIEAVRAGDAGESFQVVASEVRDLSNDTQQLATNIRKQVTNMSDTLMEAQQILQKVARVDMSENILAKDHMDQMIRCLVQNSQKMMDIMTVAKNSNEEFAQTAGNLIVKVQFQDRLKQDIDKIINGFNAFKNELLETARETCSYLGTDFVEKDIDQSSEDALLINHDKKEEKKEDVMLF